MAGDASVLRGHTVAVTGATGFLGRHLVTGLVAAGARVVGVVRRPERGRDLEGPHVELRRADLLDSEAMQSALDGCTALVSNASIAVQKPPQGSVQEHADMESRAMRGLVLAAREASVHRVVHISSVAVYRDTPLNRVGQESDPLRDGMQRNLASWFFMRGYGEAKAQAEAWLWSEVTGGLRLTVLRPGPVYGSGDFKLLGPWGGRILGRVAVVPDVAVPFVHAGDVALAAVGALANPASAGRAYNVTGPSVRLSKAARALRQAHGVRGPLIAVPLPLGVAWANEAAVRELGVRFRTIEAGLRESLPGSSNGTVRDP